MKRTCNICKSEDHLSYDCPLKNKESNTQGKQNFQFMAFDYFDYGDDVCGLLVDSGATYHMCGTKRRNQNVCTRESLLSLFLWKNCTANDFA